MDDKRVDGLSQNAGIARTPRFNQSVHTRLGRHDSESDLNGNNSLSTNPLYQDGDSNAPVDAGLVDGNSSSGGAVMDGSQAATSSKSENPTGQDVNGLDYKAQTSSPPVQGNVTKAPENVKKPWSEVMKPKVSVNRMKFEYHTPEVVDGRVLIKPPLLIDVLGRKAWENCLVGYFFEKRVAYHVMNYVARRKWANRGLTEVIMNEDNFFFFKFASEQDLLEVLEEGVCMVEGKPLILQRWYPQIVLCKEVPKYIPLWVKIFNIPLQYWNIAGLSRIGSGVGNIKMADSLTEQMCREASGRLSFAKLLIEVDARKPLPENLYVHIPSDDGREPVEVCLRVEYPWRPTWCTQCVKFGHSVHVCPVLAGLREIEQAKVAEESKVGDGVKDPDAGFKVIQQKGKEKVTEFRDFGKFGKKKGVPVKQPFHYLNKGIVIKERKEQEAIPVKADVTNKDARRRDSSPVSTRNKFELLEDENIVQTTLMNKVGSEPIIVRAEGLNDHQKRPDNMEVEQQPTATDIFDQKVQEYVFSGSKLSPAEMALMEKRIEEREKLQNRKHDDFLECETNTETEYDSEPDDTDVFMMQGIKNPGSGEEVGVTDPAAEGFIDQ